MYLPSSNTATLQAPTLSNVTTIHSYPDFEKVKINPSLSGICTEVLNQSTGNYEVKSNDHSCLALKDGSFIRRVPSSLEQGYYKLSELNAAEDKKNSEYDGEVVANTNQKPLEWVSEEAENRGPQESISIGGDYEPEIKDPSSSSVTQLSLDIQLNFQSRDKIDEKYLGNVNYDKLRNMNINSGQEDTATSPDDGQVDYPNVISLDSNLDSEYYYDSGSSSNLEPNQEFQLSLLNNYPTQSQTMPNLNSFQDEIIYIQPYEATQSDENIQEIPNYDYTDSNSKLKLNLRESVKALDLNVNSQSPLEPNVGMQTESKIIEPSSITPLSPSNPTLLPTHHQTQTQTHQTSSHQSIETAVPADIQKEDIQDSVEFEELLQDEENEEDE